jgi:CRP-like cAMP-binding protein
MIKRLFLPFERATKFRTASLLKLQRRNFHPEVKQAFSQTTSEHTSAEDTYELLKQEIIKKRVAIFRLPLGIQPIEVPYTLSNLAGHGSFIFLAVSYLESDVMSLRVYAVSGITLSILFQYYREVPLWIPIRWNALFLLINVTMILLLIKEATDANNIPEEQQHLYMMVFQRAGMKPEDFLRLMATAERKEVPKGEKLVQQGRRHQQLHLIQSGKLSVMRDHNQIGVIEAQQFAGAMSFLTWEGNYEIHNNLKREGEGEFLLWDEFSDSGFGGLKMNIPKALPVTSSASHGLSGSGSAESESSADNHHAESESHDSEIDWEMGYADVTCEEDCIVYSWSFKDLHEMLAHNPRMGLVVEGCISKG